ncbi:MAG: HEAT repeat domain-containing protein [Terriglobales bacterium]
MVSHNDAAAVPFAFADLTHDPGGGLADALGRSIKDPAALPELLRESKASSPVARAAAAAALGSVGAAAAIPALAAGIADADINVRFQAMTALARISHLPWSPPMPPRFAAVEGLYRQFWLEWLEENGYGSGRG